MSDHSLFSVVVLGPPGSGKGTQARCLERFFGLAHIDVGMELRRVAKEDSSMGRRIDQLIHRENALVPDEIVVHILEEVINAVEEDQGVILDGAPRSIAQISLIEDLLERAGRPILCALSIQVDEKSIIERIQHRYFCPRCFSFFIEGQDVIDAKKEPCPKCSYPLEQRKDDTPEGVKRRLAVFAHETDPVIEAYRERDMLVEVDGEQDIDAVCGESHEYISKRIREREEYEIENETRD